MLHNRHVMHISDELQANVEAEIEDLKSKLLGNSIVLQVFPICVKLHEEYKKLFQKNEGTY